MRLYSIFLPCLLFFALGFLSCKEKKSQSDYFSQPVIYSATVKQLNNVVLENNFPPMIAARNYVYACIAGYECMAAGDSSYQSLSGQIKHLPPMPSPVDAAYIDFQLAALLAFTKVGNAVTFPEGSLMYYYDDLLKKADSVGLTKERINVTKKFADTITASIIAWSKKDRYGATRGAPKYEFKAQEDLWAPTPPMYASAVEPYWKKIRPMVLDTSVMFDIPEPPVYDIQNKTSVYYKSLLEVKNIGDSLTAEQKQIAEN